MVRDPVEFLCRLAFLEGVIDVHAAYEHAVRARPDGKFSSRASRASLLRKLEQALELPGASPGEPQTIGEFLLRTVPAGSAGACKISGFLGLPLDVYLMLEQDRLSPLNVPREAWARFAALFEIPLFRLEGLLLRTCRHSLPGFPFACRDARRSAGSRVKGAARSMRRAKEMLRTPADLPLPHSEREKLGALFSFLQRELPNG